MGVRFPSVQSNTLLTAVLVTTAETAVVTSPPFTPPLDSSIIIILVSFYVNPTGTSTANMSYRIRRGSGVAGANVFQAGVQAQQVGAAIPSQGASCYFDSPGAVSGIQYTLTLQQGAATANGTVLDASILVFAL